MNESRLEKLLSFYNANESDSFIIFAIAKEYENIERFDKALKYYLELKEKDNDYVGLYYHLGKLYEIIREERLALSTYQEGLDIAKSQKDFHALSELNNAKMNLELQLGN
ncbi:MAG: tetratricopeptide repeat protein [Saprospiraceae bacterium]|nr:tetratricopeptide repeat protein [Bacteroidia bacterium]NNE13483.1 tetratricopeptide repeat protein [Saprospiraceae bacterium]NNL93329.1 tetratricopeptide repeat protein [Saprospiraceae bacterium]